MTWVGRTEIDGRSLFAILPAVAFLAGADIAFVRFCTLASILTRVAIARPRRRLFTCFTRKSIHAGALESHTLAGGTDVAAVHVVIADSTGRTC